MDIACDGWPFRSFNDVLCVMTLGFFIAINEEREAILGGWISGLALESKRTEEPAILDRSARAGAFRAEKQAL